MVFTLLSTPTFVTDSLSFDGEFTLTEAQEAAMLAGEFYVNVHTTAFPAGEVRGQILPEALPNQPYVDELDNKLHDGSANPNPVPGDPFGESTLGSTPLFSYSGLFNQVAGTVGLARRQQPSLEVPGMTYAGRSIFTSFGLEGMSETFNATFGITPTSRAGLLNAIVVWLNTEPGTVTVTPTLTVSTTLYTFDSVSYTHLTLPTSDLV